MYMAAGILEDGPLGTDAKTIASLLSPSVWAPSAGTEHSCCVARYFAEQCPAEGRLKALDEAGRAT